MMLCRFPFKEERRILLVCIFDLPSHISGEKKKKKTVEIMNVKIFEMVPGT